MSLKYKAIPIGREEFKDLIDKNCYYVDKTLFIKEILETGSIVNLYTRPRRFGKTLNMSMIKYFFEKTDEDNSYLFKNLKIGEHKEICDKHLGKYPVISLSLKSMKQGNFESAFEIYRNLIIAEFKRHYEQIISSDNLKLDDKEKFLAIYQGEASQVSYYNAIRTLSELLYKVYDKKVIVLIDEYDVPLEDAYYSGYYEQMVRLIRSAFESALKTNFSLEFAILTGCLRVSKESIFTGLNNLSVYTVTDVGFCEQFGFTKAEVVKMAKYFNIENRIDEIKAWYDGYIFGHTEIYNPWSVIQYVQNAIVDKKFFAKPFWSNTSSNLIIKQLIENGNSEIHKAIQELMLGGNVKTIIYEDITYGSIDVNSQYIWSFLLFTGYLKPINVELINDRIIYTLVIPNKEIQFIYEDMISQWFDKKVRSTSHDDLFNAILSKDEGQIEDILCDWLMQTISFYDQREYYYHGFVSGLLVGFKGYEVKSNRESGNGRADIMILEIRRRKVAVVIEIKVADKFSQMSQKCDEALQQIDNRNYAEELKQDSYQEVVKIGIAFFEKTCRVKID